MEFKAKIYTEDNNIPFYKGWTLSEQLFFGNGFVICVVFFFNQIFKFSIDLNENIYFKVYVLFFSFSWVFSAIYRFWEFERINGRIDGEISFEKTGIKINEVLYLFSEIKNLDISYGNKYKDLTGNRKFGPNYSQGINNHISFYHNSKFVKTYFQLYSTSQYEAIQSDLFYYVINEVFPFEAKNLSFIDEKFHHYTDYKTFIEKMKEEGKLS